MATEVFLFTDIEGSTRRWATAADLMRRTLALHDEVLGAAFVANGGNVFKHTGDGLVARFDSARAAVAAAIAGQRDLDRADWLDDEAPRVRMAIHAGEAEARGNDWFGPALNRCARLLGIGHGGQVLLSGAAHALCIDGMPEGVSARDLGPHRLRDLHNPESVWQVEAPGLRGRFPPLRAASADAGEAPGTGGPAAVRLPEPSTTFHGRDAEVEELLVRLRTERMITLLGAGGIGKSRLAGHVARLAAPSFPDGVWFCTLADLVEGDPESVPYAAADAMGVRPDEGATMTETLTSWLGRRRVLLVLDNCEHVNAAAGALAGALCDRCPETTVVATSREPLRLPWETRMIVGPLGADAANALFVQRLRGFDSAAAASVAGDDVARLCERLGNMPLALELAAARCRALSPAELAARLDDRPELLTDRSRVPAQQTLAAVLDWSVDHLDPIARRVFARLSIFQGGCTLEQAEEVVRGGGVDQVDVIDAISALVDVGLVTVTQVAPVARYVQLEPIRQHGARLLDAIEQAEVAERHASAYAVLAAEVGHGLEGPDFGAWADVAERELANLRTAHRWAVRHRRVEVAVAIVEGLRELLFQRVMTEICDWNDATVELVRGRGDAVEARALAAASSGYFQQTRYREAAAAHARIAAIAPEHADLSAASAWAAGWSALNSQDAATAESLWSAALEVGASPFHEGMSWASLRVLASGDPDLARAAVERTGSPTVMSWYRIWNAKILGPTERLLATESDLGAVVDETQRVGAAHALGVALYGLGFVMAQLPERPTTNVLQRLDRSIELCTRLRLAVQSVAALETTAFALALRHRPAAAHTIYAALDARGETMMARYRRRVEEPLATVTGDELRACRALAASFRTIDEVAGFARAVIAEVRAEAGRASGNLTGSFTGAPTAVPRVAPGPTAPRKGGAR